MQNLQTLMPVSYAPLYEAYDALATGKEREREKSGQARNALQRFLMRTTGAKMRDGFARIQQCRDALDSLDRQGWQRSFHQRMFHENFIRACARVFFKTEPQGSFARAHQAILDVNGWDSLSQEILISTPRRCTARECADYCARPMHMLIHTNKTIHSYQQHMRKTQIIQVPANTREKNKNHPGPSQFPPASKASHPVDGT
jgi:hypothetical protein